MAYETGTATSHSDLFDKLRTFLTTSTGGGGAGWTELRYDAVNHRVLLRAPGLSSLEEIHFGFGWVADAPSDSFAITGWMFKFYESAFGDTAQPGSSPVRYHPVWDVAIPYWFQANGQRVIILTKISTSYFSSYLGKILPRSAPSDYPQPYYVGMPTDANNRWSLANSDNRIRSFFDPSTPAQMLHPSGNWQNAGNYTQLSGESQLATSGAFCWPYNSNIENGSGATRYRELINNLDGSYTKFPIQLVCDTPDVDILGDLDGAYAVPAFSAASEDIIQIDGVDYMLFQDGPRTNRWNYACMAVE